MTASARLIGATGLAPNERDGPLPPLLLVLTVVTGLVDAVSYLRLGHVFVANMTGNVVFLGFAVAGEAEFSAAASLVAIGAFLVGALVAGRLGAGVTHHRGRFFATAVCIEFVLVALALLVALVFSNAGGLAVQYALIVLLALAMGVQNGAARRLGVPDMTTTVLTLTLVGLAADSRLAKGKNPNPGRRLAATAAMFIGAAIGALLISRFGVSTALALVAALLALMIGATFKKLWRSSQAWTQGNA
jgi:uncharacterized membrane protein YoaK (UPF0700 family)